MQRIAGHQGLFLGNMTELRMALRVIESRWGHYQDSVNPVARDFIQLVREIK